jgi:hypothetical protein
MTEIIVAALLTITTGSMGFAFNQLWKVSALVNRIDERTLDHERRLVDLEDAA